MERISKVLFDILLILRPIVIVDLHKDLLSLNTNQYYLTFMDKLYLEAQARSREVVRQTCWLSQDLKKKMEKCWKHLSRTWLQESSDISADFI